MTPKEKAEELLNAFRAVSGVEGRECALICAETHLDYHENNSPFPTMAKWIDHNEYWREVKKEIEKL